MRPSRINDENQFREIAEIEFISLFGRARDTNELQFLLALCPEFRGLRNPGWNSAAESRIAFGDYLAFLNDGELTRFKVRVALSFYCHLSEAAGFYETPMNLLRIVTGQNHHLWPFQSLVRHRKVGGGLVAPNASKTFRAMAECAIQASMPDLATVFRDAVDPMIRNGYAHADYVVCDDEIRFPNRNGGTPCRMSYPEFHQAMERLIYFYELIGRIADEHLRVYTTERQIGGYWGDGRRSHCTARYDLASASLSIRDDGP
jgi:hypothetical protein